MTDQTSKAVAKKPDRRPLTQRDPMQLAEQFARSGYFRDASDLSQAVVKIVAGEELGLGAMASMSGIHIIEGKPSLSANILAVLIKQHDRYDYRVIESTDERCEIEFTEDGESLGSATWTIQEAQRARTKQNGNWVSLADTLRWKNAPSDMLFARTISRGARRFCPDITAGSAAYVPEEIHDAPAYDEPVHVPNDEHADGPVEEVDGEVIDLIDQERADKIIRGFDALDLTIGRVAAMFGAAGLDGLRARSRKAIEERVAELTSDEADLLEAEMMRQAQRGE